MAALPYFSLLTQRINFVLTFCQQMRMRKHMRAICTTAAISLISAVALSGPGNAAGLCQKYGPQTQRHIASAAGENAEHKGPGFKVFAGADKHGGYKCNESDWLSPAELKAPTGDVCSGLKPGDTIQVHWVHTSCETSPGKGLSSCLSEQCANSALRVEAQAFVVVNDPKALDFTKFAYDGNVVNGLHQAKALPCLRPFPRRCTLLPSRNASRNSKIDEREHKEKPGVVTRLKRGTTSGAGYLGNRFSV